MSSLLKRTPKLSKKKRKTSESNDKEDGGPQKTEEKEIPQVSTSVKIMNEIISHFGIERRDSTRKSKKKNKKDKAKQKQLKNDKDDQDIEKNTDNLKKVSFDQEDVVQGINTTLCKISEDSKDLSDGSHSDISYSRLEELSSSENLKNEEGSRKTSLNNSKDGGTVEVNLDRNIFAIIFIRIQLT